MRIRNHIANFSLKVLRWLPFVFNIISFIYLYIYNSILWLPVAIVSPIILCIIIVGPNNFSSLYKLPYKNKETYKYIFLLVKFIFLASSIFGLYIFITLIPFNDMSYLFIPFLISSFFVAGATLDIFDSNRYN